MKNSDSESDATSSSQGSGNILRQLHDADSHGVERRREVVVRPDGSKVIRVEKRRRTYQEQHGEEKKSGSRNKRFLIILCVLALLMVGGITSLYMYRLASFNTAEYTNRLQEQLSSAWGGKVELSGVSMDGRTMSVGRVTVTFPENSSLSFVVLERVSAELSAAAIFIGKIQGESLNISNAIIGLRPEYSSFTVPKAGGELPFSFQRYTSPRLEVGYALAQSPMSLDRNAGAFYLAAEAYIRTLATSGASKDYVLDLSEQKLKIKGWPLMAMDAGSVILDEAGIRQLNFSGRVDKGDMPDKSTDVTLCSITGACRLGTDMRSRIWTLTGTNFDLSQLLGDAFASIFKVRMGEQLVNNSRETTIAFALPVDVSQKTPSMKGSSGSVIKATLHRLPVLELLSFITRKAEAVLPYDAPIFSSGSFNLESDGTGQSIQLSDIDLSEQNFLAMTGVLACDGSNLRGELTFRIPSYMADGRKLPDDIRHEGREFVISTVLSGTTFVPADQSGAMLLELKNRQAQPRPVQPAPSAPSAPASPAGNVSVDEYM